MRKNAIAIAACFLGSAAMAKECASIDNDMDRLTCYDKASGRTITSQVEAAPRGDWSIRTEKTEFKDTTDIFLTLRSDEVLTCNQFGTSVKANLIIRCMKNKTALYIRTNCHVTSGHGGYVDVEYRVDDKKAKTKDFDDSTDNKALGLWTGRRSIPVIRELLLGDNLLVRFTPFSKSPEAVRFTISGLDEAIKPLRKQCNW